MTDHYYADDSVTLYHGDCVEVLSSDELGYDYSLGYGTSRSFPDCSVDAVVTDPPYGISFMGRQWDQPGKFGSARGDGRPRGGHANSRGTHDALAAGSYDLSPAAMLNFQRWCTAWSTECLRVLKPGGYLVAFGGSRTWHRLAAGIEDAGFEIRDSIAWLFGQGFPKSLNLGRGLGTALKPAFEPIVVARRPFRGTVADNLVEHGTGALNIDGCRVPATDTVKQRQSGRPLHFGGTNTRPFHETAPNREYVPNSEGRWPTNVVLDKSQAAELDQQSGTLNSGTMRAGTERQPRKGGTIFGADARTFVPADTYGDSGGASRFFPVFRYEAKAPSSERPTVDGTAHPTVKPLDLMRWLVRLVTPPGGTVLEPFAGSGTTAEACVHEHMRCIAIEREAAYLPLITTRLTKPIEVGFDFTA